MKRTLVLVFTLVFSFLLVAVAFAAEKERTLKGTITGVDTDKGEIRFCPAGTTGNQDLKVDKSVNLKEVKTGDKVRIVVTPGNEVKKITPDKERKVIEGC
ncbi:MAG TPA: hypothetical protein VF790_07075 [Dissulfurispiraceae bacterium]